MRSLRIYQSLWNTSDASAAVEFAVTLPLLVLIIVGIVDYGAAATLSTKLYNAARAGAQYATYHVSDRTGIISAAQNATDAYNAADASPMTVTVANPAYFCTCGDSSASTVSCDATVVPCASPSYRHTYVLVSTSKSYTPMMSFRGIGGTITLNGSAVVQVP